MRLEDLLAMVREDPYDDGRWGVLEDYLLETEGPPDGVIAHRPLGAAGEDLEKQMSATWRAGYLVQCELDGPKAGANLARKLLATPAAALLRELSVGVEHAAAVAPLVAAIAASPCAVSMRSLTLSATWFRGVPPPIDVSALALRRLFVTGVPMQIVLGATAARLQSLFATPVDAADLAALLAQPLPELRDLGIAVGPLVPPRADIAALDVVFDAVSTPALRQLHLPGATPPVARELLRRIEASALLPRLRELVLGDRRVAPASLGLRFSHLDVAAVPAARVKP